MLIYVFKFLLGSLVTDDFNAQTLQRVALFFLGFLSEIPLGHCAGWLSSTTAHLRLAELMDIFIELLLSFSFLSPFGMMQVKHHSSIHPSKSSYAETFLAFQLPLLTTLTHKSCAHPGNQTTTVSSLCSVPPKSRRVRTRSY